jgi:hypothetical protein
VLIGDASGHGLAAAVVMAIVQAVLRAHPECVDGPASLLMHAIRQLHDKNLGGRSSRVANARDFLLAAVRAGGESLDPALQDFEQDPV